ncbi:uncharacterized protein [Clytia hemisphaerica]|uniref:uncharacterized protein n=1 Tax=Clytia hemisphaerica TaxID=252671 RepID=UPI0034D728DB
MFRLIASKSLLRPRLSHISSRCQSDSSSSEPPVVEKTFREKARDTWNGPTLKYWLIGGGGFISWLAYYSYQAYKNKCIDIELPPALPNHLLIDRKKEFEILTDKYNAQDTMFSTQKVKKLLIHGPSCSGKTVFANQFIKHLKLKQKSTLQLPVSNVTLFLQTDTETSFLISLKSAAAKLEVSKTDLDEGMQSGSFSDGTFNEQCNVLIENIQDKLSKHPGWVIIFDQLQSTSPTTVLEILNSCIEEEESWSSGLFVVVADGVDPKTVAINKQSAISLQKGMSVEDGVQLLKNFVNVDGNVASLSLLVEKVFGNPLALLCNAVLLKKKLAMKQVQSIDDAVKEICDEIDENVNRVISQNQHLSAFTSTYSGRKLVTIESVVAILMKDIIKESPYLYNGIDLMAAMAPGTAIPQQAITRHLASSFYKLPSLAKPPNILDFMNKQQRDADDVKQNADEFDPKGKVWSNKNLVHYIQKVEEFFETVYKTLKEIYFLVYGVLPELPKGDDGMGMFSECVLIQSSVVQPGDVNTFSLHPIVYNVARQHFMAKTLVDIEEKNVRENKDFHQNKSWYRKLSDFNEQTILQQYRNSAGHGEIKKMLSDEDANSLLFRFNLGIDVSCLFKEDENTSQDACWDGKPVEKVALLQDHLTRITDSLCEQMNVTKGDLNGHTVKKILMLHLEYILKNQPFELLGARNQSKILFALAKAYNSVYKDFDACKELIDQVLSMQQSLSDTDPLDIARTLAEKAQYLINKEDYETAKTTLLEASDIYEAQRKKFGEYKFPIEYGKLLGMLGAVYGSLSMKIESKETIERALMMQQSIPPDMSDEEKSKKFGADFASILIDLAHAYVSLGLPLYGKKIVDLALTAQKNLNGEDHPEVVRALTVLAMAHLMQGHNEESKKHRKEAGKIQANLKKMPLY